MSHSSRTDVRKAGQLGHPGLKPGAGKDLIVGNQSKSAFGGLPFKPSRLGSIGSPPKAGLNRDSISVFLPAPGFSPGWPSFHDC